LSIAATLGMGRSLDELVSLSTKQPANIRSEWVIPLQNAHRPETTTPSSTDRALPRGAQTPAATCPSPNSSVRLSAGR
jgi:hypothetical protein